MKFRIDQKIFELFPTFTVGVVVAKGLNNPIDASVISQTLDDAVEKVKNQFSNEEELDKHPSIAVWRQAFEKLGWNPKDIKASIDAMVTRIVKSGSFPHINSIVDIGNVVALRHLIPVGAHDIGRLEGDITIRLTGTNDLFTPMGKPENEAVLEGEIVYADDKEVRTRRWVWRQGDKAKIFSDTHEVFFPIDGFSDVNMNDIISARDELANLLKENFNADIELFLVDKNHPETSEF